MRDYVNIYACMNSHAMLRACMFRYCEHCERLSDIALELHQSYIFPMWNWFSELSYSYVLFATK